MRKFITALLAATALPGVAVAQGIQPAAEEFVPIQSETRSEPPARAERPARVEQVAQRGDRGGERRGGGGERRGGGDGGANAGIRAEGRGGFGGGRWNGGANAGATVQAGRERGGWRGDDGGRRGFEGRRGGFEQPAAPPVAAAPNDARRFDRNGDGRRDLNRGDRGDRRGDWARRDDDRRDWNRGDRGDWNRDRGRWDGRRDFRSWDRGWRNNSRYDWQRFRSGNRYAFRLPRYNAPWGWNYGYRRFSIGATLFSGLFAQNYWINDPWDYRLPPAEWPYQWVRYYNDALLVDTRSGYVVDAIPDIFWY